MKLPVVLASFLLELSIGIKGSILDNNLVKKYMIRMETVTQELMNATNNNIELKAQLDDAQNLINSYQNDIAALNESKFRQQDEIAALEASHSALEASHSALNESNSRQQDEIAALEASHSALEASHSALNESNSRQQDEIATLEASHSALNESNSKQQAEISALRTNITALTQTSGSSGQYTTLSVIFPGVPNLKDPKTSCLQ